MSRPTPSPLASSVPPPGLQRSGPRPPSPTRPLLVLPLGLAAGVAAAWAVGLTRPEPLAGLRALDGAALLLVAGSPY